MISVQEKINIFRDELLTELEKYKNDQINEVRTQTVEDKNLAEVRIQEESQKIINHYTKLEEKDIAKILSEGKNESKEIILKTRNSIRKDFEELILSKIQKDLANKKYQDFLIKSISELKSLFPKPQPLKIYINEEDQNQLKNYLLNNFSDYEVEFLPFDQKHIGGFILHDKDDRISFDFTIEDLITENTEKIDNYFNSLLKG